MPLHPTPITGVAMFFYIQLSLTLWPAGTAKLLRARQSIQAGAIKLSVLSKTGRQAVVVTQDARSKTTVRATKFG
jgi:hypothetical protein